MAYKARTLNARPNQPNAYASRAAPRTVAGVTVRSVIAEVHAGDPPAEMLADDLIDVQGVTGIPWPGSSGDRNSKSANRMKMLQLEGGWPPTKEAEAQIVAEAKAANPEGVARYLLEEQGASEAEIRSRIAKMQGKTRGMPDLSGVSREPTAAKRRPGRPRKSETAE